MENKELVSVVVPMYYEEDVVSECYKRLNNVMHSTKLNYELIFVNDGSKDKTIDILKVIAHSDKKVKIIDLSRNFGHQTAVTAGIFNSNGDAVVIIDADLQDPPELILDMINKWKQGFEVVYGKRKKRKGETWFKLFTAKYFYRFLTYMSDVSIPEDTGDFRLMDRKVVEVFKSMPERNRFVRGIVSWLGFNQTCIEYEREERYAGETKYPLKKMIKLASDGIISFSLKPLKLIMKLGILMILASIVIALYVLVTKILDHSVGSSTFLMVSIIFFCGIQLLGMGILGEYIGRIYDESKNRPLFIVKDMINFQKLDIGKEVKEMKEVKEIKQIS